MTDPLAPAAPVAPALAPVDPIIKLTYEGLPEQSFDVSTIPAEARLELLKQRVKDVIGNRMTAVVTRHNKEALVIAWAAYAAASTADPLQTAVPQPVGEPPAGPDLAGAYARAVADLQKGEIRQRAAKGEAKARAKADPLTAAVSKTVTDEVYAAQKAEGSKKTYLEVKAEVGDGIAYLKTKIDALVAAGQDRKQLEDYMEQRYVGPAKIMLGLDTPKKLGGLPSIL